MRKNLRSVGTQYEDAATEYLQSKGYEILARNFHARKGEIDIVARDGDTIVFVEVKYRKSDREYGGPLAAVGKSKQQRIHYAALHYIARNRIDEFSPFRFDVIAITPTCIQHYKNAFEI